MFEEEGGFEVKQLMKRWRWSVLAGVNLHHMLICGSVTT